MSRSGKHNAKRGSGFLKLSVFTLIFGVFGTISWMMWSGVVTWLDNSPWGRLQKVEVRGLERLLKSDILTEVELEQGVSLMKFPFDRVAAQISSIPSVKSARVFRRLPGRLIIRIEERRPIAVIADGELTLVDAEGVAFPVTGSGEVINLPVLTFTSSTEDSPSLDEAVTLISKLNVDYPTIYDNLSEVTSNDSKLGLKMRAGGAEIKSRDMFAEDMLRTLEAFLQQKGDNLPGNLKYVDLRFDRMIVTGTG